MAVSTVCFLSVMCFSVLSASAVSDEDFRLAIKANLVNDNGELCFQPTTTTTTTTTTEKSWFFNGRFHDELGRRRKKQVTPPNAFAGLLMEDIINLLSTRGDHETEQLDDPSIPIRRFGYRIVPSRGPRPHYLPSFLEAIVEPRHLPPPNSREPITGPIERQLNDMQKRDKDDAGHLLAWSLGGPTRLYNFIPMAQRINRNTDRSPWYGMETFLREWFKQNPRDGRMHYQIYVNYENAPEQPTSLRPVSFCVQYDLYTTNGIQISSGIRCFSNDADNACAMN